MSQNMLITGAAGYIGGSLLAHFIDRNFHKSVTVYAAVRTEEQAKSLGKLGVNVVVLDLTSEAAVDEAVTSNEIGIILHLASSHDAQVATNLIKALGKRRKASGKETFFVHTSGVTAFVAGAGWPALKMQDVDAVFGTEKQVAAGHPIRLTDIAVVEEGEAQGVTTFTVVVPGVYGRGTGECKRLSIAFPLFVKAGIKDKLVHKFDVNSHPAAVHISDLVEFYRLLTERILNRDIPPSGKDGYFFPMAHQVSAWELMDRFAERLHARGLVSEPNARVWASDEAAGQSLGLPPYIARIMGTHSVDLVPVKPYELGWKPQWNEKMLLEAVDKEIDDVLEVENTVTG